MQRIGIWGALREIRAVPSYAPASLAAAGAVAAVTAATYWHALRVGFFSDDYTWLARMPATLRHVPYVFTVFYRDFNPVLHFSFAVDYFLGQGSPSVYHATSLLIHVTSGALLVLLLWRLGATLPTATLAGLLWALGSRISESVIWFAARGHSLATLFVLAALLCLTSQSRAAYWSSFALLFLGLMTKEVAIFPMVLLPFLGLPAFRRLREVLPFWTLLGLFILFNFLAKPSADLPPFSLVDLALKAPFVLLRPLGLGDSYTFTWTALGLTAMGSLLLFIPLRRTIALRGFLWIGICLVPTLPLAKLSSRYLYLLAVGYAFVFVGLCEWVSEILRTPFLRRLAIVSATLAVATVVAVNIILDQREIQDYQLLCRPYEECLDRLRPVALELKPGETLVIADISPRAAVREMAELIESRGTILKLIPYRPLAVGGLIKLQDALNIARHGEGGWFAVTGDPASTSSIKTYIYAGDRVVPGQIPRDLPADRVLAARLDSLAAYFADPLTSR